MLHLPPAPDNPWELTLAGLGLRGVALSRPAARILRLQGLYTVGDLADAAYRGAMQVYPEGLQAEVQRILAELRPFLEAFTRESRAARRDRNARMARLEWSSAVIGRELSSSESASLARLDVRRLDCAWVVKHPAMYLGAIDALDVAILDRERLLSVETCGPARIEILRAAIERALGGHVWPDHWTGIPEYLSASHSVAGRPLSAPEIALLQLSPVAELPLSSRAIHAVVTLDVHTCLDLAAVLDREVLFTPRCGRRTFGAFQQMIREALGAAAPSARLACAGESL